VSAPAAPPFPDELLQVCDSAQSSSAQLGTLKSATSAGKAKVKGTARLELSRNVMLRFPVKG
jgi:hypothetical protein